MSTVLDPPVMTTAELLAAHDDSKWERCWSRKSSADGTLASPCEARDRPMNLQWMPSFFLGIAPLLLMLVWVGCRAIQHLYDHPRESWLILAAIFAEAFQTVGIVGLVQWLVTWGGVASLDWFNPAIVGLSVALQFVIWTCVLSAAFGTGVLLPLGAADPEVLSDADDPSAS